MGAHLTTTLRQDSVAGAPVNEGVTCQECSWRGVLGDLLISEHEDNDMLYCPTCRLPAWEFD